MIRLQTIFLLTLCAGPAFAQEDAAKAVGTGVGLLIGLAIMIVVGAIVGWLASLIVKGAGMGFWGDIAVGIGGSVIGSYLFPLLGIPTGTGVLTSFIPAVIGAILLLLVIRLIRRAAG